MALLRKLKDDYQEFPATMALGSLWVAVFIAMVVNQAVQAGSLTPTQLVLAVHNGHRFGDMTLRELYSGEIWRAVTATCCCRFSRLTYGWPDATITSARRRTGTR